MQTTPANQWPHIQKVVWRAKEAAVTLRLAHLQAHAVVREKRGNSFCDRGSAGGAGRPITEGFAVEIPLPLSCVILPSLGKTNDP